MSKRRFAWAIAVGAMLLAAVTVNGGTLPIQSTPSAFGYERTTSSSLTVAAADEASAPAATIDGRTAPSCDYYASPSGGGDGQTSSTPFTVKDFWSVAAPGKTLCLLDGRYIGATGMIQPPRGLSGTSSGPITIRALNDGGALVDGEFSRIPVLFRANSWWVLEGFNASHGAPVVIYLGYGATPSSDNNILRRIVAWDADGTQNTAIAEHYNASNNLWEDCAFFGMGRNTWQVFVGHNNTCRRCWARLEGTVSFSGSGPIHAFQPAYSVKAGLTGTTTCENCLGTWWAGSMPESFTAWNPTTKPPTAAGNFADFTMASQRTGPFFEEADAGDDKYTRILGSLSYIRPDDFVSHGSSPTVMFGSRRGNRNTLKDVMVFVPNSGYGDSSTSIAGFDLGTGNSGATVGNSATNITSIHSFRDALDRSWSVSGYATGSTIALVPSPWTATTMGANLCYRYVDGARTTTPLWPWPMDQRIKDALAESGSYTGPCVNCSGGRKTRAGTAEVTADIETLLGPIPAACRNQ